MTEQKRERGVKVLVKRSIWLDKGEKNLNGKDVATKVKAGSIEVLSKEMVKKLGSAVTRDLPEGEDD